MIPTALSGTQVPLATPSTFNPAAVPNPIAAPQTPAPQPSPVATAAPVPQAEAAAPTSNAQTMAQATVAAGQTNNAEPTSWAKNVVAGVQTALAGFGAAGKVSAGQGAGAGVGAAARQFIEQRAQQRAEDQKEAQQKKENEFKTKTLDLDQQRVNIMQAESMARTASDQRTAARLDQESMDKRVDIGMKLSAPLRAHHDIVADGVTQDEAQPEFKPGGKYDPNKVFAYQTGERPVEKNGKSVMEPTYTVFARGANQVEVTPEAADALKKYGQDIPAGSKVDGDWYDAVATQALASQTTSNLLAKATSEAHLNQVAEQNNGDKATVNPWLGAHASDDPIHALTELSQQKDPKTGQQTPQAMAAGRILSTYDPKELETYRHNKADEAAKAEENRIKAAEATGGAPTLPGSTATGAEYLGQINAKNPAYGAELNAFYTGKFPLARLEYVMRGNKGQPSQFMNDLIRAYPDADLSDIPGFVKTREDFDHGKSSAEIVNINNAVDHAHQLDQDLDKVTKTGKAAMAFGDYGKSAAEKYGAGGLVAIQSDAAKLADELQQAYGSGKTDRQFTETLKSLNGNTVDSIRQGERQAVRLLTDLANNKADQWRKAAPTVHWTPTYPILGDQQEQYVNQVTPGRWRGNPGTVASHTPAPQIGSTKTFPNGNVGVWDGHGYVAQPPKAQGQQ